jgi:hypothetical protein
MKSLNDDFIYEEICKIADLVIEIEEVTNETISKEVFDYATTCKDKFMEQVEKRLSLCKTEGDVYFVKESTFNFLLFAMRKVVSDLSDEAIEYTANAVRDIILSLKRK